MEKINITMPGDDNFIVEEAYKTLRTNIQFCGKDLKVIGLTSYGENEGKSTVCLGIGKSFSELGKKVLVIDADMRKSVMAGRNANVKNAKGLSEVLTGLTTLDNCIYSTQYEGLDLFVAGKYPPNPVELLSGKYFSSIISAVRDFYDYIFIDTPPLGRVIDASVIATQCDGMILVIGNANTHYRQLQGTVEQLRKSDCRVLGVVRNFVSYREGGYYRKRYYGKKEN